MADLKLVHGALNKKASLEKLIDFKEKWQNLYPSAIKSWEDKAQNPQDRSGRSSALPYPVKR